MPKNALGPAAETLDALHEAKAKAEQEKTAEKIKSGNPEDLFDAAEAMAKSMAALAEGALSPKKLIPTYQQLVDDAKPPLPASERELALPCRRKPRDLGTAAETSLSDAQGRRPLHLRPHRSHRAGRQLARIQRRAAVAGASDPHALPTRRDRHQMARHVRAPRRRART